MFRKILIIIVIVLVLAVSGGFVYLKFFNNNSFNDLQNKLTGKTPSLGNESGDIIPEKIGTSTGQAIKKIKIDTSDVVNTDEPVGAAENRALNKKDLERMAAAFAERFGSYSNQSNYSNINDLKIFMSQKMKAWAQNFVKQQKDKGTAEIYYGITTKAVSQEVKIFDEDEGLASILVGTRRREANNTTNNLSNFFNQNITINFIQENGIWKVDSANWQM